MMTPTTRLDANDGPLSALPLDSIVLGDCLDVLKRLPDASVDAIITDPPYFRVKGEAWDRQWDSAGAFLGWMAQLRDEWARVLKPNGSLYVFASPKMAARVEVCIGERFNVLNQIRWLKQRHTSWRASLDQQRQYLAPWEAIIFAEHYGADSMALGESGYAAQCEKARGHVFESLRAYLDGERKRAGIDKADCNVACGFSRTAGGMASRHYFSRSQWQLPTAQHYAALQRLFNEQGRRPAPPFADFHPADSPYARLHERAQLVEYLRADYEYLRADYEYLRADYEYLRADYEDLRRPFSATEQATRHDTWDFAGVPAQAGRHPCEKPLDLMRHIIRSSTRAGALILDCFAGSGATLEAAQIEGRRYLGIEREARYVAQAEARLAAAASPVPAITLLPALVTPRKRQPSRVAVIQRPSLWEVSA